MLVLLDRDGVINEDRTDFVKTPDELIFIPGALKAIAALNTHGHLVAIVTNQSCIGRGIITTETLTNIHGKLLQSLAAVGGKIDHIFFAPDAPWEATENRKPGAGMFYSAMAMFRYKPRNTVLIGDTKRDIQAAAKAGCHRILVQTGKGTATQQDGFEPDLLPVSVAKNLAQATDYILEGRFST
ncbi:MAG: HAD-IIIA family hydrolase [Sneathiella sp.]|nr:HAD-IIIA family hydrolase [Sneathiella sp.]